MVSKKALKAYEVQKKLFPLPKQSPHLEKTETIVEPVEEKIDYLKQFMEEREANTRINYQKLFWLLSIRIFFLALSLFMFFKLISM